MSLEGTERRGGEGHINVKRKTIQQKKILKTKGKNEHLLRYQGVDEDGEKGCKA